MNRYEQEVPVPLPVTQQLKVREVLATRKRCTCSGRFSCDCYEAEALLRYAAEGQPLFQSQRQAVERLLTRGQGVDPGKAPRISTPAPVSEGGVDEAESKGEP